MRNVFANILSFSLLYVVIVLIDVLALLMPEIELIRFITKPLLIILLIAFSIIHDSVIARKKQVFLITALGFFLMANTATLFSGQPFLLMLASVFFLLGKIFYIFRFANRKDFKLVRLLPSVAFYALYMILVLSLIDEKLGDYLVPIMAFLLLSLITIQFALLRKGGVNDASYKMVLLGVFFMLLADTIKILSGFYFGWPNERIFSMFIYALAQYFIVVGLLREQNDFNLSKH